MSDQDPAPIQPAAAGQPATPEDLFAFLDRLRIAHRTVEHPPVFTVEEAKALRGSLPGGHVKNLFLRNKKGDQMWLVVAEEDRALDLKALGAAIGCGRPSFGSPERLMAHLGVVPGAVTPLGLINDRAQAVRPVIDAGLLRHALVNVHPLRNDRTTTIASADLIRFIEACGHKPVVMELPG